MLTHNYAGGGLSYTQTFEYDELNRLTVTGEGGASWLQTMNETRAVVRRSNLFHLLQTKILHFEDQGTLVRWSMNWLRITREPNYVPARRDSDRLRVNCRFHIDP